MLLTADAVAQLLGGSRTWVYKLITNHNFPEPIRIGTGVRWDANEVYSWISKQKEKREEGA